MSHWIRTLMLGALVVLTARPASAQDVKIGFFAPLTGFAAADGASAKHSAEIAVEELNAGGGIKGKRVELVTYDDRHDSKEAVSVANKLVEKDGVIGVVSGSYSMTSRVTAPIFAKAGVPMTVAYAVHPHVKKYKAKTGTEADMVGASAYDAVRILAKGIELGGTDPKAICAALSGLTNYPGITGHRPLREG